MNALGFNLLGRIVVLKPEKFGGTDEERKFHCEKGFGLLPTTHGTTITGRRLLNNQEMSIDSSDIEKLWVDPVPLSMADQDEGEPSQYFEPRNAVTVPTASMVPGEGVIPLPPELGEQLTRTLEDAIKVAEEELKKTEEDTLRPEYDLTKLTPVPPEKSKKQREKREKGKMAMSTQVAQALRDDVPADDEKAKNRVEQIIAEREVVSPEDLEAMRQLEAEVAALDAAPQTESSDAGMMDSAPGDSGSSE